MKRTPKPKRTVGGAEDHLVAAEAADWLAVRPRTVDTLCAAGALRPYISGGKRRFAVDDLVAFVQGVRVAAVGDMGAPHRSWALDEKFDAEEAARFLGCSRRWLSRLVAERAVTYFAITAAAYRFLKSDLEAWMEARKGKRAARGRKDGKQQETHP